jgi:hypothetical protein
MIIITGIGSRSTPPEALAKIAEIAKYFSSLNCMLRSGGAQGADTAFSSNWWGGGPQRIFIPWEGFQGKFSNNSPHPDDCYYYISDPDIRQQASDMLKDIHPAWNSLKPAVKLLHIRNVYQVLGANLDRPSDAVVYWAPNYFNGQVKGGTATAVHLAWKLGIPTFNIRKPEELQQLREWANAHKEDCMKESEYLAIPIDKVPGMIGSLVHLNWATYGAVWRVVSVEGDTVSLVTRVTKKPLKTKIDSLLYTRADQVRITEMEKRCHQSSQSK